MYGDRIATTGKGISYFSGLLGFLSQNLTVIAPMINFEGNIQIGFI